MEPWRLELLKHGLGDYRDWSNLRMQMVELASAMATMENADTIREWFDKWYPVPLTEPEATSIVSTSGSISDG